MQKVLKGMLASAVMVLLSSPVWAVSDNECAIWLCAPAGFPQGCGAAKSAMLKRLKKFKPPFPSLRSCGEKNKALFDEHGISQDYSRLTSDDGFAASMPASRRCRRWDNRGDNCVGGMEIIPPRMIEGTRCVHYGGDENGEWTPQGCLATFRFVKVFDRGVQVGQTYYF